MCFKYVYHILLSLAFIFNANSSLSQKYPIYKNLSSIAILDQEALFTEYHMG